jgi:hypothetical protein
MTLQWFSIPGFSAIGYRSVIGALQVTHGAS